MIQMDNNKYRILIICAAILVLCSVGTASGKTWYVDDDGGPGVDFTKIQDAVGAASDGDIVVVRNGAYTENVDVNKRLTIRSENGSDFTIVQAANSDDHVFEVTADYVNISGFTVKNATIGPGGYYGRGISLYEVDHCNISNIFATDNDYGIHLYRSSNVTLTNNGVGENYDGIIIDHSFNNVLINNTLSNNRWNFGVGGVELSHFIHDIDPRNTVKGKPIQYLVNQKDVVIDRSWDIGYLGVVNSTNITVKDLTLTTRNWQGVEFAYVKNSRIENVTVSLNSNGIRVEYSFGNIIMKNTISNNRDGIELSHCFNNTITNNSISNNDDNGIHLFYTSNNTITGNTVSNNNWCGINLYFSCNNTITGNNASNNDYGIYLEDSSNNNTITSNIATNNDDGIHIGIHLLSSRNNNITCNWVHHNEQRGFYLTGGSTGNTIEHNNIMSNGEAAEGSWHYNFYNDQSNIVTAENNYWGTDNSTIINGSIYDEDDDSSKGKVDFEPFRTDRAPCAPIENKLCVIQAQTDKSTYALNENATISCTVQNETGYNITVDSVNAEIRKPDSSIEWVTMTEELVGPYKGTFTNMSLGGTYNVTIYANKTGYDKDTAEFWRYVTPLPTEPPNITSFAPPSPVNVTVCAPG